MAKVKDFTHAVDTIAANSFLDAMQEWFSTFASFFRIELATATSIRIPAGTGNDQVGIGIAASPTLGLWRYRTTNITAAHPGGAAGTWDVYVTASAPNVTPPDTDNTDYNFGLEIRAVGSPPTTFAYRKVGTVSWDGTKIMGIEQLVGTIGVPGGIPSGAITQFAGVAAPGGWLLCDGSVYDPVLYPSLFAVIGNSYGGTTAAPLLPDTRGRVAVGRDSGQTEFDTLNKKGGTKTVALDMTMIPNHNHGGGVHAHAGSSVADAGNMGGWTDTQGNHRHGTSQDDQCPGYPYFCVTTGGSFNHTAGGNTKTNTEVLPSVTGYSGSHSHNVGINNHGHGLTIASSGTIISTEGGGAAPAHANLQPYIVLNNIIKT